MGNKQVKVPIGMRSSYWWPIIAEPAGQHPTYGNKVDMGAAEKGTVTINTSVMDYYGDDISLIHDEAYVNHQVDAETTLNDLEQNAAFYGHSYADGVETSGSEDVTGLGAYGFIEPMIRRDKSRVYRATFLYKNTPMASAERQEAETKATQITPKNYVFSLYGMADNAGAWRAREDFNTEADAEAFLDACAGHGDRFRVDLEIRGDGSSVPAPGATYVASGGSIEINFSAVPTVVYDTTGGTTTDITSSLVSKKLTLSNLAADHKLLAVFA